MPKPYLCSGATAERALCLSFSRCALRKPASFGWLLAARVFTALGTVRGHTSKLSRPMRRYCSTIRSKSSFHGLRSVEDQSSLSDRVLSRLQYGQD